MAARHVMIAMTVKAMVQVVFSVQIAMVAEVQIGATALVTRTAHA
jgi:hypothetical protein